MYRMAKVLTLFLLVAITLGACQPIRASDKMLPTPMTLPVLGSTLIAQNPYGAYAFVDVNVLTMTDEEVLPHQTVLVFDQHIVALGHASQTSIPIGFTRINGAGKFLLPGLADMHIHLKEESFLLLLLANGVTTVRNMNGNPEHLLWRDRIAQGTWVGPRIFSTGPILDELPPQFPGDRSVETPAGAERIVAEHKQLGYDFIKVYDGLTPTAYANVLAAARPSTYQ